MSSKDELVKGIREILDLDLKSLDRMTREDLDKILNLLNTPAKLINLVLKHATGKVREEFLNRRLGEIISSIGSDEGILGFGIVSKMKNRPKLLDLKSKGEEHK